MSEQQIFAKCAWRLIPFMMLLYLVNYVDRVNVGFAALTMNRDLGFSPAIYGFGAGVFFFSYALCQLPGSVAVERLGPRRGIFCILLAWGVISAANAFVWSPASFYVLRFSLGVAEAGFFPGMIVYLSLWFPRAYLARCIAMFQASNPLAVFVAAPLSGFILSFDGTLSLHGWQWLFLLEGLPACLLAVVVFRLLPNKPLDASWLTDEERAAISARLESEGAASHRDIGAALRDPRLYALGLAGAGLLFCQNGVQLWAPQIVQAMGFSNVMVGGLLAVPALLAAAGMVLWGYLSDVKGERVWHFAFAALFTSAGLVIASFSGLNAIALLGLTITIIGQFAALPVLNSLVPAFLRGAALAGGIGLYNTICQLGGFLGPLSMGVLKQQTGGFTAGLLAFAVSIALAALIVLALGRSLAPRPAVAAAKVAGV